jgi:hypothetical protein
LSAATDAAANNFRGAARAGLNPALVKFF